MNRSCGGSREQSASGFRDGDDGRVLQPPFGGDGIEPRDHRLGDTDLHDVILATDLGSDGHGCRKQPDPGLPAGVEQIDVLTLRLDIRMDVLRVQPVIKRATHRGAFFRQHQRGTIQ